MFFCNATTNLLYSPYFRKTVVIWRNVTHSHQSGCPLVIFFICSRSLRLPCEIHTSQVLINCLILCYYWPASRCSMRTGRLISVSDICVQFCNEIMLIVLLVGAAVLLLHWDDIEHSCCCSHSWNLCWASSSWRGKVINFVAAVSDIPSVHSGQCRLHRLPHWCSTMLTPGSFVGVFKSIIHNKKLSVNA